MWAVVHFLTENTVEAVPIKWVIETNGSQECFWPSKSTHKKVKEAIQHCEDPGSDWKIHKIKILGEYDNYSKALQKASKATVSTDLSSANEEYLPRTKKARKNISTSSSDESNLDEDTVVHMKYPVLNVASPSIMTSKSVTPMALTPKILTPGVRKPYIYDTPKTKKPFTESLQSANTENILQNNKITDDDDDKDFKKQVIRQLLIIRTLVQQQSDTIDILLKRNTPEISENIESDEFVALTKMFPLKSENDLENMETFLNDPVGSSSMAKFLARIGGNNVKEIVRRIMYNIFSNEVGILYSWEGAKKKKVFKNLRTCSCILKAVRLNTRTSAAQDDEIINQIKGWLVRSRDRILQNEKKINSDKP